MQPNQYGDFPDDSFIVACRADKMGRRKGPYVLATRRVFENRIDAEEYAATVAESRNPLVIAGRFHQLRLGAIREAKRNDVLRSREADFNLLRSMLINEKRGLAAKEVLTLQERRRLRELDSALVGHLSKEGES